MEHFIEGRRPGETGSRYAHARAHTWTPEFFAQLLDGIQDPVYVISPADGFRLQFVNGAATRHWGYSEEELLKMSIPDWDPDFPLAVCERIWERVKEEKRVSFETYHRVSSGALIPVEVTSNYVEYHGRELIVGFIKDISERRESDEKISDLTMNLVRSNKQLEQFAYIASHDLREPLATLSSFVRLLIDRYADSLDGEAQRWMRYIQNSAERMRHMIDSLLAYSRVEGLAVKPTEFDSRKLAERVLEDLYFLLQETGVQVRLADLPTVVGDEMQLSHVLQNLVSNAIKFRKDEGGVVEIYANAGEAEWIFTVKDNGMGIDELYRDRVFEPFQKGHSNDSVSGTGLGLSICRKIIERHGGRIWFESRPGCGSKFHFTLPYQD